MIQVGMHEAKSQLSELVKQLHAGEEIQFTNRGIVVAELNLPKEERLKRSKELIARIQNIRPEANLVSDEEIISWKNEERV